MIFGFYIILIAIHIDSNLLNYISIINESYLSAISNKKQFVFELWRNVFTFQNLATEFCTFFGILNNTRNFYGACPIHIIKAL